jgi:phage/plasmid-associated DNA primase
LILYTSKKMKNKELKQNINIKYNNIMVDQLSNDELTYKYEQIMKKCRLGKEETDKIITHTSFGQISPNCKLHGKYNIAKENYEIFMMYYTEIHKRKLFKTHIIERHGENSILFVDIDLKYKTKERQYTINHIKKLVVIINKVIQQNVIMNRNNIFSYVLEKAEPEKNKELYADGIHILYPDIVLSKSSRIVLFNKIHNEVNNIDIFGDLKIENPKEKIIDTSTVYANGNLLYGSLKEDRIHPYRCTHIYDNNMQEINTKIYREEDYIFALSLLRYSACNKYEIIIHETDIPNEVLPNKKESKPDKKVDDKDYHKDDYIRVAPNNNNITNAEYECIRNLVNILSVKRASNYIDWRNIAFALKDRSNKLLPVFLEFSMKCKDKYNEAECSRFWHNIQCVENGYTLRSIHLWAKEDNIDEYYNIQMIAMEPIIDNIIDGNDYDIARIVKELYNNFFVCVSCEKKIWYKFEGHRWQLDESSVALKRHIADDLAKIIEKCKIKILSKMNASSNDLDSLKTIYMKKIKALNKKLKTVSNVNSVLSASAVYMSDKEFEKKLNLKTNILGFNNGVYDLGKYDTDAKKWIIRPYFRNGSPDDYSSLSVMYDYDPTITMSNPVIKDIETYFSQIQPNVHIKEYLLKFIASIADGNMYEQKINFFIGRTGKNGKSTTTKLITDTYGQYTASLPVSFLTEKRKGSSGPSPDIGLLDGKRFVILDEPAPEDQLQTTMMKTITSGNDKISYRLLFSNEMKSYYSQAKVVMPCNKLPGIATETASDGGTWRRLIAVPWTSEFVSNPNPANPNQFKKDSNLENRQQQWKPVFIWLLLNKYYIDFIENGLHIPEEIQQNTDKYQSTYDYYNQYITEHLLITDAETDTIKIKELYGEFKSWLTSNYSNIAKIPNKFDFVENLKFKMILTNNAISSFVNIKRKSEQ